MSVDAAVPDKRFAFSGSAVAFGGHIRRPEDAFIRSAAASVIPVSGGLSETLLENDDVKSYHYKDLVTFSSAYSRVLGDYLDPKLAVEFTHGNHGQNTLPTKTSVEARLTDLKIDQVDAEPSAKRTFTAQLLHVHMTNTSQYQEPLSFGSLGAKFEGIKLKSGIADTPSTLIVETDTDMYSRYDTREKLLKVYGEDSDFRKTYSHMLLPLGVEDKKGLGGLIAKHEIPDASKSFFVATIVKNLRFDGPLPDGVQIHGNRVTIEGFGRIFFGEIIIYANARRVTLLRFELGSPYGGQLAGPDAYASGSGVPPNS
jgi:hypothetical protein